MLCSPVLIIFSKDAFEHAVKKKQSVEMNNDFGQVQRKSLFEKNTNENKFAIRNSPQNPEGRKTLENFTDFNFNIVDPNFEKEKKKIEQKKIGKKTNGKNITLQPKIN